MRVLYYNKDAAPNRRIVEVPYERLQSVVVTDGSGTADADRVVLTYSAVNEPKPYPQLLVEQDTAQGAILHGPYDLQTLEFSDATRTATLTGTKNLFWQERLSSAGTDVERDISDQLRLILNSLRNTEPFKLWLSDVDDGGIGFTTVLDGMVAEFARVRGFSGFLEQLAENGLTAFTYNTFDENMVASRPFVQIIPRYPVTGASGPQYQVRGADLTIDVIRNVLLQPTENEDFATVTPDLTNPPTRWRRRHIVSSQRIFTYDDIDYFESGVRGVGPIVYDDTLVGSGYTQREHDLRRWTMQNTARNMTLSQTSGIMDETLMGDIVVPHQRVTARGENWLINAVDHAWTADDGYVRTIRATEWQGNFERVSVREIT